MNGKYRTAVAKGIPLLHSITLSMTDREIIYSTWKSDTVDGGIYKVGDSYFLWGNLLEDLDVF